MVIWIIIFIFLIIMVITIIVLWAFNPIARNTAPPPLPLKGSAGFLDPCNNVIQCGNGLTCQDSQCKRNIGQPCRTLSDCVASANVCMNGTCQNVSTGELNDPPPCNDGLATNSLNVCKGLEGFSCRNSDDCLSGICDNNTCTDLRGPALSCFNSENCIEGLNCSNNFCQSIATTGTEGAYCFPNADNDQATCNSGLTCVLVNPSQPDQAGLCQPACQQLGQSCGGDSALPPTAPDQFCVDPYNCINGSCSFPTNNMCNNNNQCSNNFTCNNNLCLGQQQQPCIMNNNCISGNCTSSTVIRWSDAQLAWLTNDLIPLPNFDYIDIIYNGTKQYVLTPYNNNLDQQEIFLYDMDSKSYIIVYQENYQLIKLLLNNGQLYGLSNMTNLLKLTPNMDETLQVQVIAITGINQIFDGVVANNFLYIIANINKDIYQVAFNGNIINNTSISASKLFSIGNTDMNGQQVWYQLNNKVFNLTGQNLLFDQVQSLITNENNFNYYLLNENTEQLFIPFGSNSLNNSINIPGYFNNLIPLIQNNNLYIITTTCQ